jgi:hypothetical protein
MGRAAVAASVVLLLVVEAAPRRAAAGEGGWRPSIRAAKAYARQRQGRIRFAVIDDRGRFSGHRVRGTAPMASVFKVILLVTYLRQGDVRDRRLRERDRDLLAPMIRWSDNTTATRIRDIVGPRAIRRLARKARMRDFSLHPTWGLSRTSSRDQVRFMDRLERFIPDRHEQYARRLLRTIVRSQRWGIPEATPSDWTPYFKGGWGSGTGRVTHQVAFLESGRHRVALAILTEFSPSHGYGTNTVRGVARRLLRGL